MRCAGFVHVVAAWALTFSWAWLAPPAASAQNPDATPPGVAITLPHSGAIVPTGSVIRATAWDDVAVASVRFFVDGVEIASEGTVTSPSAVWDTSSIAQGPHTVTVVARDTAGNTGSAEVSVTVDRTPPVVSVTSPVSGGTVLGTVHISADVADNVGLDYVWFSVNDVFIGEDTTFPYEAVWDTILVPDGVYTLKVAAGDKAGGLNRAEVPVTLAHGTTRIEETDQAVTYSGTWAHGNQLRAWAGGTASIATLTMIPAQATLSFTGSGVSWIGFRGPQAGIARVYLDGAQVAILDLYEPVERVAAVVYSVSGLALGAHTLIVEATGTWNPASTDPFVVVDAFIVNGW
jgi:hypothetical protein